MRTSRLLAVLLLLIASSSAAEKPADPQPASKDKKEESLPLRPARKVEFTTTDATWLSLDISSDGKTLVFDLLGDLYTLPITGGEAHKLSSGMGFNNQPKYSPDGRKIAFISDRGGAENVWIANADLSDPQQLSQDEQSEFASPSWTPDGQYVIAARETQFPIGTFELWMYHVKGGAGVQITKAKPKPDAPPDQWSHTLGAVPSPDGRYLYYTTRGGFFNKVYNVTLPLSQIARRNRITGEEDVITDAPTSAFRPILSPDGSQLVYGTRYETETGLRIRDLNSGEDRWLKYPIQRDDQESLFTRDFLPNYVFTPDGKEVIVAYGGKIHRVSAANGEEHEVPFTARVSRELGPDLNVAQRIEEGPVQARLIQSPVESPDGRRLAYSALTHLYVMDLPKGAAARVTSGATREFQPAWSPDGQWLAYVTWGQDGGSIWKTRADGSGVPQQLTRIPGFYREPAWSPDGTRIVALRAPRQARIEMFDEWEHGVNGLDLVWIPAAGGDASLILPARGAGHPHFGPEPDRVYVYSEAGLLSMRFDGTDRRTLVKVVGKIWFPQPPEKGEGAPADDVRISPDGNWALARVSSQLYLLAVPRLGGEPLTVDVSKSPVPLAKLTDIGADFFDWADGGKTITWAIGSAFLRLPVASASFEAPKKPGDGSKGGAAASKEGAAKAPDIKKPKPEEIAVHLEFPRHQPSGTVVLRGAKVITMRGDEVFQDAEIVVKDNRIAAVGKRGSVAIPAGTPVMDVTGATIVPGFIDLHPHWSEIRRGVLDMQNWSFLANLAYGVTAGRDPQTATNDMFAYQDLVELGEMLGPRAFSTGPGVFPDTDFQSLDEATRVVERYKRYYRTPYLKSYLVGNRKQRQWMVEACKANGVMPTTEGGLDMKLDLTHVLDGFSGNEHSMPITPLYNDVAQFMARSGIFYTPTLIVAYGGPWAENYWYENTEVHDDPKVRRFIPHNIVDARAKRRPSWFRADEHVFPRLAAQDAKIIQAGGKVCIGSHGQFQGLGYHWEMWSLAAGGMGNLEVLKSATIHGAEAMGLAQDLGSIEPGKLADLVVLDQDPLQDIRNTNTIRYVMKNGELFAGDTMDEVWPEKKTLAPLWWWNDKP